MNIRLAEHFAEELRAAGCGDWPLSWSTDGSCVLEQLNDEQQSKVRALIAAHDPLVPSLELARERLRAAVNTQRDLRYYGILNVNGQRYDADEKSRNKITGRAAMCAAGLAPAQFVWMDADNIERIHTPASFLGLCAAMDAMSQTLYAVAWSKKTEIELLSSKQDASAYDVTQGWPAT